MLIREEKLEKTKARNEVNVELFIVQYLTALTCGSFSEKTSKNTCAVMIKIIIAFANQISF